MIISLAQQNDIIDKRFIFFQVSIILLNSQIGANAQIYRIL